MVYSEERSTEASLGLAALHAVNCVLCRSIQELEGQLVVPAYGYSCLKEYYDEDSCHKRIQVSTLNSCTANSLAAAMLLLKLAWKLGYVGGQPRPAGYLLNSQL